MTFLVSIDGMFGEDLADGVLLHLEVHDDPVVRRDARRDGELEHRGLERDRRRAARRGRQVRDLRALRDDRLLLVGRDHARARDHLAAVVGFEGGELDVHQVAAAEVEDRQRELAGGARHRQVHVELLGLRADRDRARGPRSKACACRPGR